ncbi:hypothetical protein SmJEL517_g04675 [Synchytrium microbalum]|uniref:Translation machinery-associated protein 20 n=1 Tax=Synchytrium microbalum TaxID=1806994 RepID=A0A507C226_9FUNG|nr:uncharacterized protein SmJEL517_g04675 [Synchytrium microbalum]TPX32144.1 hypothetical protein SmJEL517_g04675 [Synchytrium microbalum]
MSFKKLTWKTDVSNQSLVKSSVQRAIRAKVLEAYPALTEHIESILPKKSQIVLVKCVEHRNLVTVNNEILFFQVFDGPWVPVLRILHKYPDMMTKVQVDKGAIKFILSGANIMCPGLTSKGARLDMSAPENTPVAVYAEGKEYAVGVGITKMSTDDIKKINKGIGVDNLHSVGDGLWLAKME